MHKKGNAIKFCLTYVEVVGQECGGEEERSDEERKVSQVNEILREILKTP